MWAKENTPKDITCFGGLQFATFGEPLPLAETKPESWRDCYLEEQQMACKHWACSRYYRCPTISPPTFLIQWPPSPPKASVCRSVPKGFFFSKLKMVALSI